MNFEQLLGKGLSFPMRLGSTNRLETAVGPQKVKEAITMIVSTLPGERLMRPTFGCLLKTLVFAPNTPATASRAQVFIEDALSRWEPRIRLSEVRVTNRTENGDGLLDIDIIYHLRTTQELQSVSFVLALNS